MTKCTTPEAIADATNSVKSITAYLPHPCSAQMPEMDEATYFALREDIKTNGLQVPLRLCDGMIIDGRARYRACRELGVEPEAQAIPDGLDDAAALASHNLLRKHWPEGVRTMLSAQLANGSLGSNQHSAADAKGFFSQQQAATRLGVSVDSLQRAKKVLDRASPMLTRAAQDGTLPMSVAYAAARRLPDAQLQEAFTNGEKIGIQRSVKIALADVAKRKKDGWNQERAVICGGDKPLPTDTQYDVILVDPPTDHIPEREVKYPTMSIEELCRLSVGKLAAPNSVLFLWASGGQIPAALEMMTAWGFKFVAQMVWDKERPGTGSYVRYRHENLFIGTHGHPPAVPMDARPESILRSVSRKHSAKPIEAHVLIEQMYPRASKIELFCRGEPRVDWVGWGNQCIESQPTRDEVAPAIEVIRVKKVRQAKQTAACNEASLTRAA